ncbi:MAG: peptidase T [Myxococcota bacterium]|nr:peptidase T [Myxococcota bacterium]
MDSNAIREACLQRFLRYVVINTQADPKSQSYPSTPGQHVLLDLLLEELKALGLQDAIKDEHGYVIATLPSNSDKQQVTTIGLMAHVDTSPETSGDGVKPIVHRNYDGGDLVLPDDPSAIIRAADNPELQGKAGEDIVTASGTTLLGADNKSGVAEIMTALEFLLAHPELKHGPVRIAFTPDEEIGAGTKFFDVEAFGASCAYTIDSSALGQLDAETFSANAMSVTFQGFNTHPGAAKGKLVNSMKVAGSFLAALPRDGLAPETTEDRQGFVHPITIEGGVEKSTIHFIIRDFVTAELETKQALLVELAQKAVAEWPGSSFSVSIKEQYRNMREILDQHPQVVENAREAIRRAGITLREEAVRGGTDGAQLSFRGLPTPNIFAGEHNYHSRFEWVSVQDMGKAVEVIVKLCAIWEEQGQ